MGSVSRPIIFIVMVVVGILLEDFAIKFYRRFTKRKYKTNHFALGRYLFFLAFPLISILLVLPNGKEFFMNVFIVFAVVGTALEWLLGYFYHVMVGQRLWTYHRFPLYGNYTSVLSLPLWGIGGVFFWLIAKAFL